MKKKLAVKTFVLSSVKGGGGRSTLCSMLARHLLERDIKAGILDGDVLNPTLSEKLGIKERLRVINHRLQPSRLGSISLVSVDLLGQSLNAHWRGLVLKGAIEQLLLDVDWGDIEMLLIDTPANSFEFYAILAELIDLDGAIVVLPADISSTIVHARTVKLLRDFTIPVSATVQASIDLNELESAQISVNLEGDGFGVPTCGSDLRPVSQGLDSLVTHLLKSN